jgi:hypothetical protein
MNDVMVKSTDRGFKIRNYTVAGEVLWKDFSKDLALEC